MARRRQRRQRNTENDYLLPAYRDAIKAIEDVAREHNVCLTCLSKAVVCGVLNNMIAADRFDHGREDGGSLHNDMIRAMVLALQSESMTQARQSRMLANLPVAGSA